MHEKRFNREIERLRDPERIARLEVERVITLSLEDLNEVQTALDVGTGSGVFAEKFAMKGLKVTGLDANPEMLAAAQKYVPSGTFQDGIAEKMPFADASFDLVFMGLLLHETDDTLAALQEARRVGIRRLAVLEWPYEEQLIGPPLEHRIPADRIAGLAQLAGFPVMKQIRLENLVLSIFDLAAVKNT